MVRLLQSLGVLSLVLAVGVLSLCARQWFRAHGAGDPTLVLSNPASPLGRSGDQARPAHPGHSPPLLVAAQALEAYLNPPAPPAPVMQAPPEKPVPVVRPPADTPKFTLRGTIYCPDQPQRSLALVCEAGTGEGGHWVRPGAQLGHFVIRAIRPGAIVCEANERLCEMVIEDEAEAEVAAAPGRQAVARDSGGTTNNVRPAPPPPGPAKRPRANPSMAVGSPRTAALN